MTVPNLTWVVGSVWYLFREIQYSIQHFDLMFEYWLDIGTLAGKGAMHTIGVPPSGEHKGPTHSPSTHLILHQSLR